MHYNIEKYTVCVNVVVYLNVQGDRTVCRNRSGRNLPYGLVGAKLTAVRMPCSSVPHAGGQPGCPSFNPTNGAPQSLHLSISLDRGGITSRPLVWEPLSYS